MKAYEYEGALTHEQVFNEYAEEGLFNQPEDVEQMNDDDYYETTEERGEVKC